MGALGVAAGLMPRRNLILLASSLCSALFCIHFLRLGSPTGAAMCAISLVQSLAAHPGRGAGAFRLAAVLLHHDMRGQPLPSRH
jgi:hypothetical protein